MYEQAICSPTKITESMLALIFLSTIDTSQGNVNPFITSTDFCHFLSVSFKESVLYNRDR